MNAARHMLFTLCRFLRLTRKVDKTSLVSVVSIMIASMLIAPQSVQAKDYPERPISLVIGYAPGGGTDIVGRALAHELEKDLG